MTPVRGDMLIRSSTRMSLRGGVDLNIATMDARLRDEILLDCQRMREGKLPLFIENIGKNVSLYGSPW